MRRFLSLAVVAAIATALLALPIFNSSLGAAAPVSVIVELKDDSGAVYKAKAEKSGVINFASAIAVVSRWSAR